MYDFDKKIDRRNTDCIKWDTFAEAGVSEDTLPMFIADMDFEVLPEIKAALLKRVEQSVYGYTKVTPHYYEAIINWMENRHQWHIEKDWIVPMCGVVPAINASIQAFTDPGDAVLILPPVYAPFKSAIEANERVCVESPLVETAGHYTIDFDDVEEKISQHQVRMFILCNPHNPVGRVWTREELEKLTSICMTHHVIIVSDEIHQDFVFKPHHHIPAASINEKVSNYTITCTAPGKTFNLAGLQTANIVIKNPRLREAFSQVLHRLSLHEPNMMGTTSCEAAYTYGAQWVDELVDYIQGNMTLAETFIRDHVPGVSMVHPEGLYLAWLDFRALKMNDEELKNFLLYQVKVRPNTGDWFGPQGSGFARINFACPRAMVQQFLDQLAAAVQAR